MGDGSRWSKLNLINIQDDFIGTAVADVIRVSILLRRIDAFSSSHETTTTDSKYQRIVSD